MSPGKEKGEKKKRGGREALARATSKRGKEEGGKKKRKGGAGGRGFCSSPSLSPLLSLKEKNRGKERGKKKGEKEDEGVNVIPHSPKRGRGSIRPQDSFAL